MRIMIGDIGSSLLEQRDDIQCWRFADVVDVRLVGDADDENVGALDALLLFVECSSDLVYNMLRHGGVDLAGELDEAGLVVKGLHLPGEVVRIERDAVATDAGSGIEGHETEGFAGGGLDDLPDIEPEPVAHQGGFIGEGDVDRAEGILVEFDHLGDFGRGDGDDGLNRLLVEITGKLGRFGIEATDDLGCVGDAVLRIAGVDPLGREGEEKVFSDLEPGRFELRKDDLAGGSGKGRAFEHNELAGPQGAGNLRGCGSDVRDVRIARLAERGRDADRDDVGFGQASHGGGGGEAFGLNEVGDRGGCDILDVGCAAVEGVDGGGIDIEAEDIEADVGKGGSKREADIAETDDAKGCMASADGFPQPVERE